MSRPAHGSQGSTSEPGDASAALGRGLLALALTVLFASSGVAETTEREASFAPHAGADWPTADARDYGYDQGRLSDAIERIGADEGVYSVLVVRGGELIAEQYFREGTRTKIHNLKSASKSIVSALVGLVIADGSLALDDSVVEVLDVQGVDPDRRAITVRDVLMMASGLESTSYEAYNAWIASSDWVRGALRQERLDPPGTRYRYSTGNTHLLSALVRRASGQSTRSFAEARLFGPVGIEIGGWETDPQGIHIGGNNLALTPRDMAKFGELFLRGGRWRDRQVVPADWVRESTRIQIAADHEVYGDYGYQWFVSRRIPGDFVAVGFGGQYIYVSPAYDAVVVITSTLESKGREWEQRIFDAIEQDLLRADGVRTTSLPVGRDDSAFGPAGAVTPAAAAPARADVEDDLRAELARSQAQVSSLEDRVDTLVSQRDEEALRLRQIVERNDADRQQMQVELDRSQRALQESGRERARLAQLLEESERRAALAAQEMTDAREGAATREATQDAEVTRLRRLVADTNDQLAALQSQAQTRELEFERAKAELTRLEKRVEERDAKVRDRDAVLDDQLERFEAERTELEAQLAEERSRADQTLREVQRMRQAEASLRADLDTRVLELDTARERARTAEQALEVREARLTSLQADLETLRAQGRADAAEREELSRALGELRERAAAGSAEQSRLEARVAELGESEELARVRGDELTRTEDARARELQLREAAEQQVTILQATLADEQRRATSLESELEGLRTRLVAQERNGSDAAAASAELDRAQRRIVALEAEIVGLQQQNADRRREADQLGQRLEESQRASGIQLQQLGSLRDELRSAEEQRAALEAETRRLRADLQSVVEGHRTDAGREAEALAEAQARATQLTQQLTVARQETEDVEKRAGELERQLIEAQAGARDQASRLDELGQELRASNTQIVELEDRLEEVRRTSEARRLALEQAQAEATSQVPRARVDELVAQLESRDRSLAALQQELAAVKAAANAESAAGTESELARLRQNYEALVAESEMLARRSGEQGRRINELEQRLAATRAPEDLDREVRSVRTEVERLLGDRRLSEVLRADLLRLRRALVALQQARESDG